MKLSESAFSDATVLNGNKMLIEAPHQTFSGNIRKYGLLLISIASK